MLYLMDTNVAVRAVMLSEALHPTCINAIANIALKGDGLVVGSQVLGESWSLLTRPTSNKGGYGLSIANADVRLTTILRLAKVLPEPSNLWDEHRRLLVSCSVLGTQVHDCRLAAWCLLNGVDRILTLNSADFKRFAVQAVHPNNV